ncbi:MAG: DUF3108 domain-containing protein [Gemmatimonadota bacterium]|nr:DUF3108 domain-containing protein [Gemmatimonadota bacterium]
MAAGRQLALTVAFVLGAGLPVGAQRAEAPPPPAEPDTVPEYPYVAEAPFGPGEHLVYGVKVGIFGVGEGHMSVHEVETVRGNETYRATMGIEGSLMGLGVEDKYTTWFDLYTLQSWRYIRDVHQVNYESYRHFEFFPERKTWERQDNLEWGPLGSSIPLDDISFVYYIRTLPLEVGDTYTLDRYFKDEGNPVVIRVVRKDERETDAGTFETVVVKPVIKTDGLFGEGGDAELHFTDDDRRLLVYMKSNIPKFPGSLTLHLRSIQEGVPLHPESRAAVMEARAAAAGTSRRSH